VSLPTINQLIFLLASSKVGYFIRDRVAKEFITHHYMFGNTFLSQNTESTLSELGMDLLEDNSYGTIRAIRGQHPLTGISAKYREAHIRRLCNQSKSFDSFDDFIAASGTHELKSHFVESPSPDKPYVNYLIIKRLVELEEPMEIDESE